MKIEEFEKNLDKFINNFDNKLELDEDLIVKFKVLNKEGYGEWKALYQVYNELKDDEEAFKYVKKFYSFTTDNLMKIFGPDDRKDDRKEFSSLIKRAY